MPSKPLRIACDVHTHTIYSRHAYSTIGECVRAAAEAGLELLGSTDHFGAMLFPTNDARNFQHFIWNMAARVGRGGGLARLRGRHHGP